MALLIYRAGWLTTGVACIVIAGCGEEPPPPTASEFVDDPILLEAALVRCRENRGELKYDAECRNAREAANRVEAAQTAANRAELEAQSERKRQALRRAQEAAAEARRRAAEAERLRREAELLGQYESVGEGDGAAPPDDSGVSQPESAEPVPDDSAVELPPPDQGGASDLESVREEPGRQQQEQHLRHHEARSASRRRF